MKTPLAAAVAAALSMCPGNAPAQGNRSGSVVWTFDRLDHIGGHKTIVLGEPKVIDSPLGKAVEFDGIDDALFVENHPLAGAETFTWEAVFRPDSRGHTTLQPIDSEIA